MRDIIVMMMLAILSGKTTAQENNEAQAVPADVVEAFSMLYPKVNDVHWNEKEKDEQKVHLIFNTHGIVLKKSIN